VLTTILWLMPLACAPAALLWLAGGIWIRRTAADSRMNLFPRPKPDGMPVPRVPLPSNMPSVTLIIAAHNEESRIRHCLEAIRTQDYPNLRVLVVDDRSKDRTGGIVRQLMREDDRLALVEIDHLPAGCVGKTHALAVATADVRSDYLLFLDCDCYLAPGAVSSLMEKVSTDRLDFVSLWPWLELRSPSERLLTPPASWLLGLWAALGARRGAAAGVSLGNGQFMCFSREAYERCGGHRAVLAELAEDAVLARRARELGLRSWIGIGRGLYSTTRQNSWHGTWNALTRVFVGTLGRPWRFLVSICLIMLGILLPVLLLPSTISTALRHDSAIAWFFVAVCLAHVLSMAYTVRGMYALTLAKPPSFGYFIPGALVNVGVLAWACLIALGRGHVRWGSTRYRVKGSRIVETASTAG